MAAPSVRPSPAAPPKSSNLTAFALDKRIAALESQLAGLTAGFAAVISGPLVSAADTQITVKSARKNVADVRDALGETNPIYRDFLHASARKLVAACLATDFQAAVRELSRSDS